VQDEWNGKIQPKVVISRRESGTGEGSFRRNLSVLNGGNVGAVAKNNSHASSRPDPPLEAGVSMDPG